MLIFNLDVNFSGLIYHFDQNWSQRLNMLGLGVQRESIYQIEDRNGTFRLKINFKE